MVFCLPRVCFFVECKVWEVDDPCKVEFIGWVVKVQILTELFAYCTEGCTSKLPVFIAYKQQKVILFGPKFFANNFFLTGVEFRDTAFENTFCVNLHPCKTLCLVCFCNGFQSFNLLAAVLVCNVLYNKSLES